MMPFKLLHDGMADGAVVADGAIIALILQWLNVIALATVFVVGRIEGMGAAVTGLTLHHPHQILTIAKQLVFRTSPDVKRVQRRTDCKKIVTGKAVKLLAPGLARIDGVDRVIFAI